MIDSSTVNIFVAEEIPRRKKRTYGIYISGNETAADGDHRAVYEHRDPEAYYLFHKPLIRPPVRELQCEHPALYKGDQGNHHGCRLGNNRGERTAFDTPTKAHDK